MAIEWTNELMANVVPLVQKAVRTRERSWDDRRTATDDHRTATDVLKVVPTAALKAALCGRVVHGHHPYADYSSWP